ncbi:TonB-dependent receptor [Allosphingosinicella flava]|uniref:TonB-dependent receptor n=1 Tax=Allosphingosinicella flava TaxID=2771430 RepID=A0A7T2GI14_9SPHN|nr:TonB-dependent receptor [Sphingosinicella flava]QPQ54252.1 TonB-dependent receptor [Sphingosinicella flava]
MSLIALTAALGAPPALAQTAAQQHHHQHGAAPAPANANATPSAPSAADKAVQANGDGTSIIVTGTRLRGSVIGDIPPEISLNSSDIRAYGAGTITQLLDSIAPQVSSGRGRGGGRPIVLLNGQRPSSFMEIHNLPPEAIERVDILPEEVALKYGFRADQRVVNLVLRERFRGITTQVGGGFPTAGGRSETELDVNLLRVRGETRLIVDAEYDRKSKLLESERDVIVRDDEPADAARYRTLLPADEAMSLGATVARPLGTIGATLNGSIERTGSESLLGLPETGSGALMRTSEGWTGHGGFVLNGQFPGWSWSAKGNYDHIESTTLTDRSASLRDRATSNTEVAELDLVASGTLFRLPAGEVSTTLKGGAQTRQLSSQAQRGGTFQDTDLSRTQANLQANIDLPIASRRDDMLAGLGNLSANVNLAHDNLSDFGALWTIGGGINWSPVENLRLIASVTQEDGAPSIQQLGDPSVLTPNVRVFDFTTGETVDISRLDGGNPALLADSRRVMKLGLNIRPLKETDLSLSADFIDTRIRNPIASFPTATPEIEAAFPDRFTRDANGRLLQIDSRPVNFARSDKQELRWGFNFTRPLKKKAGAEAPRHGGPGARPGQGGPAGSGGGEPPRGGPGGDRMMGGMPGGGRGPMGGGMGGFNHSAMGGAPESRLQLSVYHTWRFKDEIEIRDGVPVLDLLDGSATGSRGGQPRHAIEARAGVFKNGLGARLNLDWQAGTRVLADRTAPGAAEDLFFSDSTTVGLRFFADLGMQSALSSKWPFLHGARVSLDVDNLFDSRLRVRDRTGATPVNYQPDLLDPLGRTVRVRLRKLFF